MIQAIGQALARLCIWIVGLPSVSLETRRAEAAREARHNVVLGVGYRSDDDDDGGGDGIEARGIGFGEYLVPECDCDHEGDDNGRAR